MVISAYGLRLIPSFYLLNFSTGLWSKGFINYFLWGHYRGLSESVLISVYFLVYTYQCVAILHCIHCTVLWWFSFVGTVHHVLTAVLLHFSTRSTVRPVWIILVYMWFQLYAAGSIIIRGTARSRAFVCFFIYSFWWWPYRIYGTIQTCQSFLRVSSSVQTGCGRLQHDVWLPASVP